MWALLTSPEGAEIWLGPAMVLPREPRAMYQTANGVSGELRSFHDQDRIRLTWRPQRWDHDPTVQVTVRAAGDKTTVRFHQEWLASAGGTAEQRTYWAGMGERVGQALAAR